MPGAVAAKLCCFQIDNERVLDTHIISYSYINCKFFITCIVKNEDYV